MKQRFDHLEANRHRSRQGSGAQARGVSVPTATVNAADTVSTPAPTSGAWLSEALKLWCTEPHPRP